MKRRNVFIGLIIPIVGILLAAVFCNRVEKTTVDGVLKMRYSDGIVGLLGKKMENGNLPIWGHHGDLLELSD